MTDAVLTAGTQTTAAAVPKTETRKRIADHANTIATALVISTAFCGIASIFVRRDYSIALIEFAMLAVVLAYFFYLAAAFVAPHDHEHRFRHVVYQSAAFIVLALSLRAFGLHEGVSELAMSVIGVVEHAGPNDVTMNARSVGELAAVMILFILVEIAAFVAQDVEDARMEVKATGTEASAIASRVTKITDDMKAMSSDLGITMYQIDHLQLVASVAQLDPSVMTEAIKLTKLWSIRAPNLGGETPSIEQRCWRILLRTYLQEERHDFWPGGRNKERRLEGIPRCVRPVGGYANDDDISYFATNVGFYVEYLAALVHELQQTKTSEQKVCIAAVTNMLPAHWWNWTYTAGEWRAYTAIEDLRKEMWSIAHGGAQVDRVIAVDPAGRDPEKPTDLGLWPESLLYDMLANWQILADREDTGLETLTCSSDFETAREEIGSKAFKLFPKALQNGALSTLDGARIYPMITRPTGETYETINHKWTGKSLCEAYTELQEAGKCWPLRVTGTVKQDLDEHFDVMFIGLGPATEGGGSGGLWTSKDVNWGVCLMNSYDAAVETMFLSVISHESARNQFDWWRRRLGQWVAWGKKVADAADDWKAEKQRAGSGGTTPVT